MCRSTSKYDLLKIDTDRYWSLVRETLETVFGEDTKKADELEDELRTRPTDEQVLFYNLEPLTTATGIVGRDPTDRDIEEYKTIRAHLYHIPRDDFLQPSNDPS